MGRLQSKLGIIGPSSRQDCDVDYTFGQVSFQTDIIDYKGNCGNISAAVGGFAIDEGMVRAVEPVTRVRIHLTNSGSVLTAEVPVVNGKAAVYGDFVIDGCPGSGARITLDWSDVAGGITGNLLPTGNVKDVLGVDGKHYPISLVDAGNPLVFIHASSLCMSGTESPAEIEGNGPLMAIIEKIRGQAAVLCGLVDRPENAAAQSPYNPFFAIVSERAAYTAINGKHIASEDVDIVARLLFMLKMHKAYPITGTVCTGAACRIPGTVAWEVLSERGKASANILIGHPSGVIPVEAKGDVKNGSPIIERLGVYRTARRIMDGYVYVRKDLF
ncbi:MULTISPECIES: PrpF domain-containing protein [unclassified Desulfovibrio]|uniref:PrpF domain-containing protein n=1 Tax=unclassified Desulfovibrio TaxID=2593640 RepID=UPI000F5F19F7|nr:MULTISPECIES: PrpF domain-containing protein [unclassified Desulfovibrio]RRD69316.1 3-methylitaconate isomerase [Desulfovibrio sp. OH1209_COT-279]RRD86031.1 3-methylitaconate isomerase [Desulfovibrio sp. OH1186_COT-070]